MSRTTAKRQRIAQGDRMMMRYRDGQFFNGFDEPVTPELLTGHPEETEIRRQLETLDTAGRALRDAFGDKHFSWPGAALEMWEWRDEVCWHVVSPSERETSTAMRFATRSAGVDEFDVIAMAAAIPAIAEKFPAAERDAGNFWAGPDWILTPSGGKEWL